MIVIWRCGQKKRGVGKIKQTSDVCGPAKTNFVHCSQPVLSVQVTSNVQEVAADAQIPPSLLVLGESHMAKEMFLMAENTVIFKLKRIVEAPLILISAFYSYNMFYPNGTENFYTFLEYVILDKKPTKLSANLSHFISILKS